ncbi:MAG: DUF1080 domain-containing protein [Alphaproteobacteria bacterium]|nr:DUF1080 domain-containing protein [Alphaproteobacteria bacterium]
MKHRSVIANGVLFAAVCMLGLSHEAAGQAGQQNGMVLLTDGTSLANFDQAGNANWHVAERTVVSDRGAGFLVTKQSYGDFRFRAEFWADEETNSGIFIRCANPQAPSAATCYEVNIFDNNPNRGNATGSVVGIAKPTPVPQTALKWNVIEVEAKGTLLNVSVNGERTVSVHDTKHARGRIALQRNSGVIRWHKVEVQALTPADIAENATPLAANCQYGFAVIWPGQPMVRDISYTTSTGINAPAKQFYVEQNGSKYWETVVELPNGPRADYEIVMQALAELSKKGEVRFRGFGDYDPGMPGGQLNIFQPNGRQIRASIYMANHRLFITETEAVAGEQAALLFEQSITLINHVGTSIDRVNAQNDPGPPYDCGR